jgi:hypothetical protein
MKNIPKYRAPGFRVLMTIAVPIIHITADPMMW